ncbi:MAG: GNAT family N-acetyltransferase [Bacteroidales bacterium]|nr:GNAT family N-acetyltransferase [Bacteroidales bacterium]
MDRLVRKIEIPLARRIIQKAGLYLVPEQRLDELAEIAADAYRNYPLHNWFTNGAYNPTASKLIMKTTLAAMKDDAVIFADSEELNGFAVWVPLGFTGSKTLPFLLNGGVRLLLHSGLGIIRKLLVYETFAMKLKKKHTGHVDWYLYNLSVRQSAQGKGIASKLMKPMLRFCDDEKMIVYLETNNDSNVPLYRHYGFELQETNTIPGSSVEHYSMIRNPN